MKFSRRTFLGGAVAGLFAPELKFRLDESDRTLVLVQLTGGNDGLNTLVPFASSVYYAKRPTLAIAERDVLKLNDTIGFHPLLENLSGLYSDGGLAIIQGAGYPNPIRSHFRSMDIWHTGHRSGRVSGEGWISRACDLAFPDTTSSELVVHVGNRLPYSLRSASRPPVTLDSLERYRWVANPATLDALHEQANRESSSTTNDRVQRLRGVMRDAERSSARLRTAIEAYEPSVQYPRGRFGQSLATVAATLAGGLGSRVLSVELDGFDTHGGQLARHEKLLGALDRCLGAFHRDLANQGMLERVTILVFSEFGRRVKENASRGTDHGTAGPMFVLGGGVRGGLHGEAPAMKNLEEFDLEFTTDFRSVYAPVIEHCFAVNPDEVLGQSYPHLELFTPR